MRPELGLAKPSINTHRTWLTESTSRSPRFPSNRAPSTSAMQECQRKKSPRRGWCAQCLFRREICCAHNLFPAIEVIFHEGCHGG